MLSYVAAHYYSMIAHKAIMFLHLCYKLTDSAWELIADVVSYEKKSNAPRSDDRPMLNGILSICAPGRHGATLLSGSG